MLCAYHSHATRCICPAAHVASLLVQARLLENVLAAGLGWDFRLKQLKLGSDEGSDDEDGPVVVELSEQQLAELEAQQQ
jgi:hypothetical protein